MKDAFTAAYSELVQNQIEFASTTEATLDGAALGNAPSSQIAQVQDMLNTFNAQVDGLAKRLVSKNDEAAPLPEEDQPGTTSFVGYGSSTSAHSHTWPLPD